MKTDGSDQKNQSLGGGAWEKLLSASNQDVLEILKENVTWWMHAALTCESSGDHLSSTDKEKELESLLLSAVYRQRAVMHVRFIEQLRWKCGGDAIKSGGSRLGQQQGRAREDKDSGERLSA
jgi:hypothetical protein